MCMNLFGEYNTALVTIYSQISVCCKFTYPFIVAIGMAFMIIFKSFSKRPFKDICSSIEAGIYLFIEKRQFIKKI